MIKVQNGMRFSLPLVMTCALLSSVCLAAPKPLHHAAKPQKYLGSDVMASVDGSVITRREVTYVWVETDDKAQQSVARLLFDGWPALGSSHHVLSVPRQDIYQELYSQVWSTGTPPYAGIISNLITEHLVRVVAARKHIVVTSSMAAQQAHLMFNEVRQQHHWRFSDAQLLKQFHVPYNLLINDLTMKLQTEKLYSAMVAARLGHPINDNDWVVVRCLYTSAAPDGVMSSTSKAAAQTRLEGLLAQYRKGTSFKDLANHSEYATLQQDGGLIGPSLRDTYWPAPLQAAIYALKPGAVSKPVYYNGGWWAFKVKARGAAIGAANLLTAWNAEASAHRDMVIVSLRRAASIKSSVKLPPEPDVTVIYPPTAHLPTLPYTQRSA